LEGMVEGIGTDIAELVEIVVAVAEVGKGLAVGNMVLVVEYISIISYTI